MKKLTDLSLEDRSHLSISSIAICGLARNCARSLPANIKFVEWLRSLFCLSIVAIVENDSTDKTRTILDDWSSSSTDIFIIDGDKNGVPQTAQNKNVNPYYSRQRVTKLAHFRNQYVQLVFDSTHSFDYLLVIDWDVDKISWEGVLDSFSKRSQWDAVTACGYSISPRLQERYHDSFALVFCGEELNPQTEKSIKSLQANPQLKKTNQNLLKVYAAFGGLAIYKAPLIKNLFYSVLPNQDAKVEVRCEHFSLCSGLQKRGLSKGIYMNPQMHLRFDRLSSLVARKIKDLFH